MTMPENTQYAAGWDRRARTWQSFLNDSRNHSRKAKQNEMFFASMKTEKGPLPDKAPAKADEEPGHPTSETRTMSNPSHRRKKQELPLRDTSYHEGPLPSNPRLIISSLYQQIATRSLRAKARRALRRPTSQGGWARGRRAVAGRVGESFESPCYAARESERGGDRRQTCVARRAEEADIQRMGLSSRRKAPAHYAG